MMENQEMPKWQVDKIKRWEEVKFPELLEELPIRIREILKDEEFEFLESLEASKFFTGKSGTGKTVDAFRHLVRWHKTGFCTRRASYYQFYKIPKLLQMFRDTMNDKEERQELIETCLNKPLLILDDLGAVNMTDYVGQILYMIIDHRFENRLITYYTSNFTLDELSDLMQDDRITRRIASDCKNCIKIFNNKPYI